MEAVVGGTQEVGKEDTEVDKQTINEIKAFTQHVNIPGLKVPDSAVMSIIVLSLTDAEVVNTW